MLYICIVKVLAKIHIEMNDIVNDDLKVKKLPFAEYILGLPVREQASLRRELMYKAKRSESIICKYIKGEIQPKDELVINAIVKVIRRHSGDNGWTADNLFPVEFYK